MLLLFLRVARFLYPVCVCVWGGGGDNHVWIKVFTVSLIVTVCCLLSFRPLPTTLIFRCFSSHCDNTPI